jgi:hypothetical protein
LQLGEPPSYNSEVALWLRRIAQRDMKNARMICCVGMFIALAHFFLIATAAGNGDATLSVESSDQELRTIRVAVFDVDVLKGVDADSAAVTDQVGTMLAALPRMTVVNRDQIKKVADEHQIALSGLADSSSALKLGKYLSAQYILVGRASKVGQTFHLFLKIVNVETTVQTSVAVKAAAESGFGAVLTQLDESLPAKIRQLQSPKADKEEDLTELRKLAQPLLDKVLLVTVEETHVSRPLRDPAAQMAIMQRLRSLGISVTVPKDPVEGWKESLLQTGSYGGKKIDYLLEGEGTSAFAAQIQGLTSCRARVELRLISVPGRAINVSDRGVAAGVDLVEALAAKTALEDAGTQAADAVIRRSFKELNQK